MDIFAEQIVKKKKTALDWLFAVAVAVVAAVVSFAIWKYVNFLLPMIVLVVWGAWWLITNRNLEYEYSITNGEMDVDCIIAQRRRKRLCSITCSKVEEYGKLSTVVLTGKKIDHTIMAASSAQDAENYYFIYRSKMHGRTLVIFQPNERIRQAFYAALPRLMQMQMDKQGNTQR